MAIQIKPDRRAYLIKIVISIFLIISGCVNSGPPQEVDNPTTPSESANVTSTPAFKQNNVNIPKIPENKSAYNRTVTTDSNNTTAEIGTEVYNFNISETELLVSNYIDQRRINHFGDQHRSIKYDTRLAKIALNHSWEMARTNRISHNTHSGDFADRIHNAEYKCSSTNTPGKEIITAFRPQTSSNSSDPETRVAMEAVRNWMDSDSHREGMLTEGLTTIGVGIYIDEDGLIYVTAILCA